MQLNYIFFWGKNENYQCFSNWHTSSFCDKEGKCFSCVEQYMMYRKALLFGDIEIAQKIMSANSPAEHKKLGRLIKNFDNDVWDKHKKEIVKTGLYLKFSQNKLLKDMLLSTKDDFLVEASPYDRIWGIGFDESNALDNIGKWGENLLGLCLMEVRSVLKAEADAI